MTEEATPLKASDFKVTTNGVVDYVALLCLHDPDMLLPEDVKQYYQTFDEETQQWVPDLTGALVIDVCAQRNDMVDPETGNPIPKLIRMGSERPNGTGTLTDELELEKWLTHVESPNVPMTFAEYDAMCKCQPQPEEL